MPEEPSRFFRLASVPRHTYKFGHHRVRLSPSLAYWDDALLCAFLRADPDHFDDAIAWSASMRNAPSWRSVFAEDLGMAARAAVHHGETVGLQPDPDERRCALFSPVTRPQNVRARQQAARIARDFAALSDHHTWVHNIRVSQVTYPSKLDHGAGTARTNSIGKTVSTMAVQEGRLELLPPLLAAGADLHACTLRGEDALMFAAHAGHAEIIRFLLKDGADPGRRNRVGQRAADFASQGGHHNLAGWLRN